MINKTINYILALVLLSSISLSASSEEIKYKVSDIPKELKENARSVVRNEEIVFEVKSIKNATLKVTYAITILNKNGFEDSEFIQFYDKFTRISNIKGRVFDENGKLIKKLPSDDILDYSAISGFSLYEDSRVKYLDPKYRTLPFTVEYSYETTYNGLFQFPSWYPQPKFNFAVEKSSYKAIIAKGFAFRYLEKNSPSKVRLSPNQNFDTYYWEAKNLKALINEPFSSNFQETIPCVIMAPYNFEIDGYEGNLNTWGNMGLWISKLNEGKNILSEDVKRTIRALVENSDNDFEKILKIYEYMQGRTRYVSIQVGIGGWQPFDAATVHRLSYGDCKALTNYMKSMLEVIGIKSNYCLVYAGESAPSLYKEFPSSQFNHAFLCVPLIQDTIWLECTSQRLPCGFIGDFTDDRDILLIDKDASKVVHTKTYSAKENQKTRTTLVSFENSGNGSAIINTNYHGLKYNEALQIMLSDDIDKKRKIAARISLPSFEIQNFSFKEHKQLIPYIEEKVNVSFHNYGTQMGNRVFLPLNFANKYTNAAQHLRERKTDIFIKRPSLEIDTVIYQIPDDYKVENLPKPTNINTQFGDYHSFVNEKDRKLIYIRTFLIKKGKYSPSVYPDFVDFLDQVSIADGIQCSLIKDL